MNPKKRLRTSSQSTSAYSTAQTTKKDWAPYLRDRKSLTARGKASAEGIYTVKNQLQTINSTLRQTLLSDSLSFGMGEFSSPLNWERQKQECLFQMRELLVTLNFHLDEDKLTRLPDYESSFSSFSPPNLPQNQYYPILDATNQTVGNIALCGLVERFSGAIFSDHHGLRLHAVLTRKPELNIYYHSLDATYNFMGGSSGRSSGGMLSLSPTTMHPSYSYRGVVGFQEQLLKVIHASQYLNVIVLAEISGKDVEQLVGNILNRPEWILKSTNPTGHSGANDITILYKKNLSDDYVFSTSIEDIGKCVSIKSSDNSFTLVASHILNKKAKNKDVSEFMHKYKVSAIFGDTNMSTEALSSKKFGFTTVESTSSILDSKRLLTSNSASTEMFDKLLVRRAG